MFEKKPFIVVEMSFDKVKRYGDAYRPHLVPTAFQHLHLGVQFDWFAEQPIKEKFIAIARLLYDGVDYSTLINGTGFLVKEGTHTVGSGKVITASNFDFSEYPMFTEYLHHKLSGNRKQSILHKFIETVSKDFTLLLSMSGVRCASI